MLDSQQAADDAPHFLRWHLPDPALPESSPHALERLSSLLQEAARWAEYVAEADYADGDTDDELAGRIEAIRGFLFDYGLAQFAHRAGEELQIEPVITEKHSPIRSLVFGVLNQYYHQEGWTIDDCDGCWPPLLLTRMNRTGSPHDVGKRFRCYTTRLRAAESLVRESAGRLSSSLPARASAVSAELRRRAIGLRSIDEAIARTAPPADGSAWDTLYSIEGPEALYDAVLEAAAREPREDKRTPSHAWWVKLNGGSALVAWANSNPRFLDAWHSAVRGLERVFRDAREFSVEVEVALGRGFDGALPGDLEPGDDSFDVEYRFWLDRRMRAEECKSHSVPLLASRWPAAAAWVSRTHGPLQASDTLKEIRGMEHRRTAAFLAGVCDSAALILEAAPPPPATAAQPPATTIAVSESREEGTAGSTQADCPVELRGIDEPAAVCGKETGPIFPSEHLTLGKLVRAWNEGRRPQFQKGGGENSFTPANKEAMERLILREPAIESVFSRPCRKERRRGYSLKWPGDAHPG